jgi:branched-subunit amino acid transport protein
MQNNIYIYILVMAVVTYLIRMLPLAIWRKEITSPFVKSFLFYVPYACLAAMTFPAILSATGSVISGAVGFAVALYLAYKEKSLLTVALFACAAVFVVERIMVFL